MDDDAKDQGLSGWAGYALGRLAAERDQHTSETMAAVFGRRLQTTDGAELVAQNRSLAAENAKLRERLTVYHENYTRLKEWADRAEAELARLRVAKA
jgi:regulator of replication initiation timing